MYAGIAMTAFIVVSVTLARLVRDLLLVRLIRTLVTNTALSPRQRFEICARLASALGPDAASLISDTRVSGNAAGLPRPRHRRVG
jgi:hypothetical protein